MEKIPIWFNEKPPIYDISKSYLENAEKGPFFDEALPILKPLNSESWLDFLGHKIQTPIGVPAGPLLNSKYISLASKLGFDVLTYKTIRSHMQLSHPLPNMLFVELNESSIAKKKETKPTELSELTLTNSFGMPSRDENYLLEDINQATKCLSSGQIMIVSVTGSQTHERSLVQDFMRAASIAKEAGAKIIEANFSCPNIKGKGSQLYLDPEIVFEVTSSITKILKEIPLIIKVGMFPTKKIMEKVMINAARAGAQGICGVNSISKKVIDKEKKFALGESRPTSGICGAQIKKYGLKFVRDASDIKKRKKLNLTLLGCGGIVNPNYFNQFLDAGADIAMSATAMMWDPYLAIRWREENGYL